MPRSNHTSNSTTMFTINHNCPFKNVKKCWGKSTFDDLIRRCLNKGSKNHHTYQGPIFMGPTAISIVFDCHHLWLVNLPRVIKYRNRYVRPFKSSCPHLFTHLSISTYSFLIIILRNWKFNLKKSSHFLNKKGKSEPRI